uniref:VWFD domain-containing protein n=1 Tax=Scleropages formosus TaxID=113540 RepID=A0A8C9SH70_SCLFO
MERGNNIVELYQSGMSFFMEADFGLTVQYDWQQYITITVADTFAGRVCGLCGNFNGKQGDDLTTPNGSEASSVVALGKSWRVQGAPGDANCGDECSGQCEDCKSGLLGHLEGEIFCSLLTRIMEGPFKRCNAVIEPKFYKQMCLYDFCMANPQCPENSHYELCGNPCPTTCDNPSAPSMCNTDCVETCACDEGYIRSGNQCVPPSECGCQYEGHYVQAGKSFWGDSNCSKRCQCSKTGGKVTCEETSCQSGQLCMVLDGIRDCHPTSYATCLVSGDPHYLTFDGQRYNFQGTCVYQMAGVCSKDATLEPFDVLVQNDFRGNRVSSTTKLVEVRVYGQTIVISEQYPGVNGELANLPVTLADENVMIYKSGLFAVVQISFGVKISFDWNSVAFVIVPSTYEGAMCGLCGNYNQNPKDDMKMKDGEIAANGTELGQSWRVAEIPGCVHGCKGPCPDCDITQKVQYETNQYCGLLQDPQGPFSNCFSTVDPSGFFQDCLYDVCLYKGQNAMQCKTLTAYTAACQSKGVKLDEWRTPNFCGDHYELCSGGCPATCDNLSPHIGCKELCQEGCTCNKSFILSGNHQRLLPGRNSANPLHSGGGE